MKRLLILCFAALPSCALMFKSKDDRNYYAFQVTASNPVGHRPELRAHIRSVRIPGYLDREELVYRTDANALEVFDRKLWGESLDKEIARNMAASLRRLLGTSQIVALDSELARSGGARATLDVELTQFERGSDGAVRLEGIYAIRQMGEEGAVSNRSFDYTEQVAEVQGAADHAEATVAAMNRCLDRLNLRIARDLLR
ncbi:hypothetical protein HNR46_002294 [Haloferula luteola]|uniref:ABC-type transport auxiliary lipoprotein component domain-containing protein n=1 Tax=Haloferula luteola TaxID=595692 RepID=A0A840V3H6_9BACT|nr:PqiC family protein [Haloferula luteola]MBB5352053.1 hypothetical protein [Haloferula luteola]